jgi:HlyD family secretion protein
MQVLASLDESDVGRIRPGQTVRFRVDAFPTEEFIGSVTQVRLQPTTVQNVVTYQTVIDVPNPELKLKPGMTANVNIEIARRADVLRVPNTALRFRPTPEIFTALGQTPPPAATGGGRGRGTGAGPDTRNAQPAPSTAAQQAPAAAQQRPAAQRRATTEQERPAARTAQQRESAPAQRDQAAAQDEGGAGSVGASRGDGRGGGGGGRRGNFAERMASMTPEERQQFIERMRARGLTPPGEGQTAPSANSGDGRGQGPRPQRQRQDAQASTPSRAAASGGPTTFDALFGPLTQPETFGQVWLNVDNKLQRVRVRLGISDGQQTELIQAMDGTLQEGSEVVTNVLTGAVRQPVTPQGGAAFPGLGGGRQGFPGGGGGRGRGGG